MSDTTKTVNLGPCPPGVCERGLYAAEPAVAKQSQLDAEKVRRLLREVMGCHADPADAFYNECDKGLCGWCEQAADILAKQGEGE